MSDEISNPSIKDAIEAAAVSNIKSLGEQPAMLANLAYSNLVVSTNISQQNAVSNQQGMNQFAITVTAKAVQLVSDATLKTTDSAKE